MTVHHQMFRDQRVHIQYACKQSSLDSYTKTPQPGRSGTRTRYPNPNRTVITEMWVNSGIGLRYGSYFQTVRSSGKGSVTSLENPNKPY